MPFTPARCALRMLLMSMQTMLGGTVGGTRSYNPRFNPSNRVLAFSFAAPTFPCLTLAFQCTAPHNPP